MGLREQNAFASQKLPNSIFLLWDKKESYIKFGSSRPSAILRAIHLDGYTIVIGGSRPGPIPCIKSLIPLQVWGYVPTGKPNLLFRLWIQVKTI